MSADLLALLARATLAASAAIVIVLVLRQPLRAAFGAQLAYAFWLLVPITTFASFLPARRVFIETPPPPNTTSALVDTGIAQAAPIVADAAQALQSIDFTPWLLALWLAGAGATAALHLIGQYRFIRNAYASGPAIVGVVRPHIVLPRDFNERFTPDERDLVLAHERSHLAAWDAQINAIAALAQCLNWFNPLVHMARAALRVDQELACDARVMTRHAAARRIYAEAMLKTQLSAQTVPLGCQWPPAGAGPLKQRIAMLARPLPGAMQRASGAAICSLATLAMASAVWIAQPPHVASATERQNTIAGRAMGAQLVRATKDGEIEEARRLVEAGAGVNYFLAGDGTPLVVATQNGNEDFARFLIEHGADVNVRAPGDGNPLIMASAYGNMELVTLFIEHGADVNGFVRGDETPLINAARENRLDAARYLIAHGADVNLEVDAPTIAGLVRRSPLSEARRMNHTEMIALLTEHGATR